MNNFFSSVCTVDDGVVPEYSDRISSCDRLSDILITPAKVLSAIKRLKLNAAAGPDYIPPIFYSKLQHHLCVPLRDIFTQLLNSAVVPDEWRIAFVTPIFKKGTSSDANNYTLQAHLTDVCYRPL